MSDPQFQTDNCIIDLLDFLDLSPTAWHAVSNIAAKLRTAGFEELFEQDRWKLQKSGKYFVIRNGSSICAFVMPTDEIESIRLAASHTDSPGFKLKPNPEYRKENMLLFGLEVYGGPLLTSWLNRDLGIAGRITYLDKKNHIKESLIQLDDFPLVIPQLAIHLDKNVNDTGLTLNKQDHLAALVAINPPEVFGTFLEARIHEKVDCKTLLSHELFLYPLEKARLIGYQKQLISSYRIDSLNSVHAITSGYLDSTSSNTNQLKMITFWDNEEVGSETAQGAGSNFYSHVVERVLISQNQTREDFFRIMSQSLCVSVDLSHAMHPNYSDKHEPRHPVLLGKGLSIKYSAQQRYATNAQSMAEIAAICIKEEIPFQKAANRGDMPGGTTIGPIHATVSGMPTVDIGTSQLSMHSCREIAACKDHLDLCHLISAYFK